MPRQNDAATSSSKRFSAAGTGRETVIFREIYRPGSLRSDFERLSGPAAPMTDADILSLLLKYFHATVYPGSEAHAVPLAEISDLLGHLCDLWSGTTGHGDVPEGVAAGDHPLRMLADLPRTAHIFRSVANRPLPPALVQDPFVGLDCGTGSGILLAAAWFQARRNGAGETRLLGLENDAAIGNGANALLGTLGIGQVRLGDAGDPAVRAALPEGPLAFVGNELLPAAPVVLASHAFCRIHAGLFATMPERLKKTIFFPEALLVRDRETAYDVVLSKNNRFQMPKHCRQLRARPRSIVIEGRLTRLRQIGRDFRQYLPETWLEILPCRW